MTLFDMEEVNTEGIAIAGGLFTFTFSILIHSEPDCYCQFFSLI